MRSRILIFLFAFLFSATGLFAQKREVVKSLQTPGSCTTGAAFDGKYIWLADRKSDKIYKVDTETGNTVLSFPAPGYFPTGIAWDGKYLWVADREFQNTSMGDHVGKIYKMDPATGMILQMIYTPTADPQGLAWDGEYLWMSDNATDRIYKISTEDGTTIVDFRSPSTDPQGLAWDGKYLWIADRGKDEIYRVEPFGGRVVMILNSPAPYPRGLAWDGKYLWNADYQADKLFCIDLQKLERIIRKNKRHAEIVYTHEVRNFGPGTLIELNVFTAIPQNRPNQKIISVKPSEETSKIVKDQWGQKLYKFTQRNLEAGTVFAPFMTVEAEIYEVMYYIFPEQVGSLKDIPEDIKDKYLADGSKYWINDSFIKESVKKAVGDTTNCYWIARNIFDYINQRMHYELAGGWNVAPTVLKRGSGSCSEYSFVYISMCRAAGLPARYVGSVVVRGDDASLDDVFHRWVEVYLPGYGWVPVDPSGGDRERPRDQAMFFGHLSNRFLITTQGGGGSKYLGWDYNSAHTWKADGPVTLREEKIGEWSPLK